MMKYLDNKEDKHMEQEVGIIFDVQRCSMHDGPGIRTTVFLKGCPLACQWCHNPESQSFKPQLGYFREKCHVCRRCESVCETSVHHFEGEQHEVKHNLCTACGKCITHCPNGALKLYGQKTTVQEIMEIVLRDLPYYEQTGGGLTISGGEPLAQLKFTKGLLKASKSAGIHTCIETSGYAPTVNIMEILPFTDYFLFDYKVTGEANHKVYTGASQKLILENLEVIYNSGKKIMLRCPIIPNVNDNQVHYEAIRALNIQYPNLEVVEFLPYHDLGKSKEEAIGWGE